MLELAGRLRNGWSTYFNHIHGLVYVMDMSLNSHLEEMIALREALFYKEENKRLLEGIPILLLLNKSQLFIRKTANDAEASLAIVTSLNTEYLSWFQDSGEEPNPLQFVWTDAVSGGGLSDVDRLDWFVETIAIRQNPSMLQAIRSVIG
jgi:hypothetical protein